MESYRIVNSVTRTKLGQSAQQSTGAVSRSCSEATLLLIHTRPTFFMARASFVSQFRGERERERERERACESRSAELMQGALGSISVHGLGWGVLLLCLQGSCNFESCRSRS